MTQEITGWIPGWGWGTYQDYRLNSQYGALLGQPINDSLSPVMFLSLSPSPFLPEKQIEKEKKKNILG